MLGRCPSLSSPRAYQPAAPARARSGASAWYAVSAGVLTFLLVVDSAQAHRLDAQAFLLPNGKVQVESWFSDGTPAQAAKIEVFKADNQVLAEGRMDNQGVFVFPFTKSEPLRVVVSASGGHRKELSISAKELASAVAALNEKNPQPFPSTPEAFPVAIPLADRSPDAWLKDVIIGVGFLLALAAFVLSLRNAQRLREMSRKTARPDPER